MSRTPLSFRRAAVLLALALVTAPLPARAGDPVDQAQDLPVLSEEVAPGSYDVVVGDPAAPVSKVVDGRIDDWVAEAPGFGGTEIYSAGEFVYQDHLFDAHGPDDGRDAERQSVTGPASEVVPGLYRVDSLAQADLAGELGVPIPERLRYDDTYGDATGDTDHLDIEEVRLAEDGDALALLVRTTTMRSEAEPGVLVLADTGGEPASVEVPFTAGITSEVADVAFFLTGDHGYVADLASGSIEPLPAGSVATDPSGYTNAVEARLPRDMFGDRPSLTVATGPVDDGGEGFAHLGIEQGDSDPHANLANVAFRTDEPVRSWFEARQALALHDGTIDPFFVTLDKAQLAGGATSSLQPGPGYHDRIFVSTEAVATEGGRNGIFQHYGLFLPSSYDGVTPSPLQLWLHWRGGNAHTAAAVAPKIFKHFGEDEDTIVVSPSGRGTSHWYVGVGHVDFRQVYADVFDAVAVDDTRVYVTGHSMGGWGSYLLTLLYPDRFAAGAPFAGPVTQGAWTGADFDGCDDLKYDEYTPCYIEANGSRPRDQMTRKILENALHVPYAIFHGIEDELVPYPGVARQVQRLVELGYRHRFYTFPAHEHYSHPIFDQWTEAASYMHQFTIDPNPARVVYKRDMPFERATEEVRSEGKELDFDFDSAYWMSGLTPVDETDGVASFDGRSLAIPEDPYVTAPDGGAPAAPGQSGPFLVTGLQWLSSPLGSAPQAENGFSFELSGARSVQADLTRMQIDTGSKITGAVTTDGPLELRLAGGWTGPPEVLLAGEVAETSFEGGVLTIGLPAGTSDLIIR